MAYQGYNISAWTSTNTATIPRAASGAVRLATARAATIRPQASTATGRVTASASGAGSSSGGALAAALKVIRAGLRGNVVTLFPDRGDRYISKGLFPV